MVQVLDKGHVELVDMMPSNWKSQKLKADEAIVQAARVSYDGISKGDEKDAKLVKYLIKMNHWTPVEHVVFKFRIKCPIFVQRHIVKHRTTSMNEISARYTEVKDDFYVPEFFRGQSKSNRQASQGQNDYDTKDFKIFCQSIYNYYKNLLNSGVSREMARMILPQNMYTEFYWKIDLRNLLHFCKLRNSPDAQWETQQYAQAIENIIKETNPVSYEAYQSIS